MESSNKHVPVLAVVGLIALAALGHLSAGDSVPPGPLPFDPLSAEEQQTAVTIALGDPLVQTLLLDGRYATIGAALRTEKLANGGFDPDARRADVWFYHYSTDLVVWPVVDLRAGAVSGLQADVPRYQPALTVDEMIHAEGLALAYPDAAARIPAGTAVISETRLWTGPATDCPVHRCVVVRPYVDDQAVGFVVKVDLSADQAFGIIDDVKGGDA